MTVGVSVAFANQILNAYVNATGLTVTEVWIKLHIGDPGAAGTANPAVETTRQQFIGAAPSGGAVSNATDLLWALVTGSEDYTHWSSWNDETGGSFLQSGTLTSDPVTAGDTFVIPAGDLDITVTTIAA